MGAAVLKRVLSDVETELFYRYNDKLGAQIKAGNITICNTSSSNVNVWLSFCVISGMFSAGLVLSETEVLANETISIEITERFLNMDNSIRGFASVPDVITLSLDLTGDITQDDIPPQDVF